MRAIYTYPLLTTDVGQNCTMPVGSRVLDVYARQQELFLSVLVINGTWRLENRRFIVLPTGLVTATQAELSFIGLAVLDGDPPRVYHVFEELHYEDIVR